MLAWTIQCRWLFIININFTINQRNTHTINSEKKVVIVVGVEPPIRGIETINSVDYELRVICIIKANRKWIRKS